jgi:uncharacterized protein (DUF2062 family)
LNVTLSIVLVCAVLASLAVGVVLAYWICLAMFEVFRVHSKQVQERRSVVVPPVPVLRS